MEIFQEQIITKSITERHKSCVVIFTFENFEAWSNFDNWKNSVKIKAVAAFVILSA